ncbi:chemotaxis protein CheY [Intrasporangium oryzae NRRL B-24470]|uniref:Chemotaxis protein CheY n=1 Tax=Intrasporangium oryzae NRRL B-24470 TaxID=1386089 RepID=W9G715_9MICO|nr:response regulator transcription factor [Intrasporangium oryzae]EWT01825.1 chemotaxis protein CheY [Intrasporangium oryzae NRRL B-24470]
MSTILVVDDDQTVREVVTTYLTRAGLDVVEADDGPAALAAAADHEPALVVLDLTLPGLDGLEVFRRLRAARGDLPVVMLTARGDESDRVLGLEIGADDYVTKPFSSRELVLRIQSILRRAAADHATPEAGPLVDGDLRVDRRRHEAWLGDEPLPLTSREFDLLAHFLSHPGQAFSRQELMRQVWGWEYGDESTVTVHVRRLREKVEADPGHPVRLQTVWGVGYRWDGAS